MAKILIVGCGDVGSRLASLLAEQGHEVYGLRRSKLDIPGVQALTADVTKADSLIFPVGLDYVFVILAPGEYGEESYRRVYLEGTRNVLDRLQGQNPRRIFWVSSSGVYGQESGEWVDESSPADPAGPTSRVLRETEKLFDAVPWPATIVRFAGIYGPGRLRLLDWVRQGKPVQAEPPAWTNRIHVDDCAGILAFLFVRDLAGTNLASVYIGTDDHPAPQHEVLDWMAGRMGLPCVAHESRPGAGSNKRLSNQRISALGYVFRFPDYQSGYAAVMGQPDQIR